MLFFVASVAMCGPQGDKGHIPFKKWYNRISVKINQILNSSHRRLTDYSKNNQTVDQPQEVNVIR